MKIFPSISLIFLSLTLSPLHAEKKPDLLSVLEKHVAGSEKLADDQDELAADVQQLIIEQTIPQVIELLDEVETIMNEAIDFLEDQETGGATIAAQTEIIEKIHAAAKARQEQSGSGDAGSAMLDMMEHMMDEEKGEGEGGGEGEGEGESEQGGQGQTGDSDEANTASDGNNTGKIEQRTVPKAAGKAGKSLPPEFQSALDAYNRGLEEKTK